MLRLVLVAVAARVAVAAVSPLERSALVDLYNTAGGSGWSSNTNWLVGDPCDDSWFGVTCDGSGTQVLEL